MANSNAAVTVISCIIVVGVFIGLIASGLHDSSGEDEKVSGTSVAVTKVCYPTDYKQACVESMFYTAHNRSSTAKDYIKASFNYTIFKVKEAVLKVGRLPVNHNATLKMALDDCKDLLQYAIDELEASFNIVKDNDLQTLLYQKEPVLKNWLTAILSYYDTCLDGVTQQQAHGELKVGLLNSTHHSSNCLAIVSSIAIIMENFSIPLNTSAASRRLLHYSRDPPWLASPDRKLLETQTKTAKPNATVAQDGSGQYKTIGEAVAAYPSYSKDKDSKRYVIYVKAGIYAENLKLTVEKINVYMYGDGPTKTIITGNRNYIAGVPTLQTATFAVLGSGFMCKGIGFENTAGPQGHQAVALRVQSDMSAFYNCRMDGYQSTLYVQAHRQFYRNCVISGTVDFIFGYASAFIQNSLIIVRAPMDGQANTVTAQGRTDRRGVGGIVIQNCEILPEQVLYPVRLQVQSFLGRPWRAYSRTVVMESTIGDFIQPAGWMAWDGKFGLNTLSYAEYSNRGPGANTTNRVKWKGYKVLRSREEALQYTAAQFLQGDTWLGNTDAPYFLGLKEDES